MADGWDAFNGPATSGPIPQGSAAQPGSSGQGSDGWAAFDAPVVNGAPAGQPAPTSAAAPVLQPGQRTGYAANAAAAVAQAGGGVVNAASDPVGYLIGKPLVALGTGAYNLGARAFGYDKLSPEDIASLTDDGPGPGDKLVSAAARAAGAPDPANVVPGSAGERYLRAGVGGAASLALMGPGGGVSGAAGTAALGGLSGVGSQAASDVAPDDLKPAAGVLGGIAAPMLPAAGLAGVRGVAGMALNPLMEYASPALGMRRNALADTAPGQAFTGENGAPLRASPNQVQAAGNRLLGAMQDPVATRQALDAASPMATTQDGRPAGPTAFQLTRDPGLQTAEQDAARGPAAGDFQARAAAQNDVNVGAIRGIADGADPAALPAALQHQADEQAALHDARVDQVGQRMADDMAQVQAQAEATRAGLGQRADQALQAIGGDLPAGSDAQVGAALRAPVAAVQRQEGAAASQMYDAVAPDGNLALSVAPYKQAAAALAQEATPSSAPMPELRARLMNRLANMPDVVPYNEARDIQQQLSQGMRDAKGAGDMVEHRRLSILRGGVEDSLSGAAADPAAQSAPSALADAAPADGAAGTAAPNVGGNVYTASGQRVGVRYELADAGNLVTSHDANMTPNPAFPAELQPRQRDRAASALQVQNIAARLEPERLGASSTATDGAPIVGPDGIVESGNGRVLALRQAYAADGPQAASYRDWLAGQGHDTTGMQQPVLIRRRTSDMTPEQRIAFAADGNAPGTMSLSASEQAAVDARRLTPDVLGAHQGGDVTDPANRDFVRSFARNVVDPGQANAFAGADGSVSRAGADRARAALAHRAYGDAGLTATLAETTDPAAKVLAGAMQDAAGPMAQLRAGIERGNVDPGMDLAPALVEATGVVQRARGSGLSLADAVGQRDAFNQVSPEATALLHAAYGENLAGRMSQAKMATLLEHYATEAQQQQATAGLFGDRVTSSQVLDGAISRYGKDAAEQAATGTTGRAGSGAGPDRYRAPGPGLDAPGPQTSGGIGQGQGVLPAAAPPELTPNFDAAAAARLRAANAKAAENVDRFRNAPGVGDMLKPGPTSGTFRTADSAVPSAIVRVGTAGADTAKAYLRAGGTAEGLADAAAFSLRQAAMKDGVLDPAAYARWAKDRAAFLSQIPDAAARFGAAADAAQAARVGGKALDAHLDQAAKVAQRTINDATAARATAIKASQDGVVKGLLGGGDPVQQVGAILKSKTAERDAAQLGRLTENDPDARAALRRAVAEYILRDLKGNEASATGTETALNGNGLQTFLRNSGPALRHIMAPADMTALQGVADSLASSGLSKQRGAGLSSAPASTSILQRFAHEMAGLTLGGASGAGIGTALLGPAGGYVGGAVGAAMGKALQAAREAGVQTTDHLVSQALLNPALMRVLLTKATPENQVSMMTALGNQLRRMSLVSAVQGPAQDDQRRQQAAPAFAVQHNDLARLAPRAASYAGPPVNSLLR